jgi:hypothetical protein
VQSIHDGYRRRHGSRFAHALGTLWTEAGARFEDLNDGIDWHIESAGDEVVV